MARTKQRGQDVRYGEKLNNLYQSIDNYTRILSESMLYDLRQSMNGRILAAGKSARLDVCDEKIYDAYIRLVGYYKKTAAHYEGVAGVLVSPKIKSIMEGIQAVISSRISFHSTQELSEKLSENPIFVEKKSILNNGVSVFGASFDALSERFIAEALPDCARYARELFVTLEENTDYMADGLALARYIADRQDALFRADVLETYASIAKDCVAGLNDMDARGDILRYNELLEQEREILAAIVKIQNTQSDRGCSPTEEAVVDGIFAMIGQVYDELEQDVAQINASLGESKKETPQEYNPDTLWDDGMLRSVLSATNYTGFASILKSELAEVCRSLEYDIGIVTEREVSNRLYARAAYEYRKLTAAHILMAEEMIKAFKGLADEGRILLESLPEGDDKAIIGGITETMQIKIESLEENTAMFSEEVTERLKSLRRERPRLVLKSIGKLEPEIDPKLRAEFFESYRQRMQRNITAHQEFAGKKSMAFKKECLLFEIITFEEIINYSVSRLSGGVKEFTDCVGRTWSALQDVLSKNEIMVIKPEAHDMFNGREHEVLMAERNPEFKKGEIIKLMNCGYKQDGVVLVRANVIAAV